MVLSVLMGSFISSAIVPQWVAAATTRSATSPVSVSLKIPDDLAVGPSGALYIVDVGRDQILKMTKARKFVVVAGTGVVGDRGDGGLATKAELGAPGNPAFAPDGELYFIDGGSIRRILNNGVIQTYMGIQSGTGCGWYPSGTPISEIHWSQNTGASAIAFSPSGELYVADSCSGEIFRVLPDQVIQVMAGLSSGPYRAGVTGMGGPALDASIGGPSAISFDGAGDLYIFAFNIKALLMVTPQGTIDELSRAFYPRGSEMFSSAPGAAMAPNLFVLDELNFGKIDMIFNFSSDRKIGSVTNFIPVGVVRTSNGTIYVDDGDGTGYSNRPALIELSLHHQIHLLWSGSTAN